MKKIIIIGISGLIGLILVNSIGLSGLKHKIIRTSQKNATVELATVKKIPLDNGCFMLIVVPDQLEPSAHLRHCYPPLRTR